MLDISTQKKIIVPGVQYGKVTCFLNLDKVLGICWTMLEMILV